MNWPFWGTSSPLTFHNVKNHGDGGAEGEPGGIAGQENKGKIETNRNETTKKDIGAGQTIQSVFFGVGRLGCLGCLRSMTFGKVNRVTKEGAQKWPKFNMA